MNLLKKVLRGIFYFCVGIKTAFKDFVEWYTTNRAVPRALRNRASLAVIALAVVAGGWGLFAALSSGDSIERREPVAAVSQGDADVSSPFSSGSDVSDPGAGSAGRRCPKIKNLWAICRCLKRRRMYRLFRLHRWQPLRHHPIQALMRLPGATRFTPVTADQLSRLIKSRAKDYQENPVNTPPAAGDIDAWKAVNSDVFGWITVPNTNISYPLVYHTNTNYYTSLGYYKEPSRNGVIWADADTRFDSSGEVTSRNLVLYGHNWTNCWRPVRIGNPADVMVCAARRI